MPSKEILRRCRHSLTRLPATEEHQLRYVATYTDSQTGLKVECEVKGWTDIAAITAGYKHTVGLRADSTVVAVGHGIINKAIQAVYWKKEMKDVERMTNCEVRILKL